jgi:hypothetical protein
MYIGGISVMWGYDGICWFRLVRLVFEGFTSSQHLFQWKRAQVALAWQHPESGSILAGIKTIRNFHQASGWT